MTNKIMIPVLTVAIAGATLFGFSQTAQAESTVKPEGTLVQAIAEKFGLNQAEVQAVFDDQREKHHEVMQQKLEERLNQAVKDGKITEDQKTKILEKHAEFKQNHESLKDMTPEERRTAMQQKHDELKSWAEAEGIDLSYLMMGHGMGRHHMEMGKMMTEPAETQN